MNKNIVLVINSLEGRGGERSVLTLAEGFYRLNFNVHIVYFSNKVDYDLPSFFTYHLLDFKKYKYIVPKTLRYKTFAKKVDGYIRKNIPNYQFILSNLTQPNLVMAHSQLPKLAFVIRNTFSKEREAETKSRRTERIRFFAKAFVKHPCICISQGVAEDLQKYLKPYIAKKASIDTHVIYNAFDADLIRNMANQSADEKLNMPNSYLIHVGAFSPQKDHDTLLRAYAKSSQTMPLLLLGQGKLQQQTKALADKLGITDNVIFKGFCSNPYAYIKQASGLVLSSRYEGFGRVIVESIVLETPVISTDCPSGPNELLPTKNLVDVGNVDSLAKKMNALMNQPQEYHVAFDDKFLPTNIAKQYLNYFNSNDI